MHALAFVAADASEVIGSMLPELDAIIHNDKSTIVRDYVVDVVGDYASASAQAVEEAYPILKEALIVWEGKHTHLPHLGDVVEEHDRANPSPACRRPRGCSSHLV